MRWFVCSAAAVAAVASSSFAATFVSNVEAYASGDYTARPNATAATGSPALVHSGGILSPFNPAFAASDLAGIGRGGSITLSFPVVVNAIAGPELGIFTNVGLVDANYPSGQATSPAATFDVAPRVADVEVSLDGVTFTPVARQTFDRPANGYTNATDPFATTAPANAQAADFGKPFLGTLASFDGQTYPQMLTTLNGSAGGTWLDVPASVGSFRFVRLSIPTGGIAGSDNKVLIDGISAANAAVPEPSAMALLSIGAGLLLRRKRR